MVFYWNLSDRKSPQVSRALRSILADLNNALVWIVSPRPVISQSSSSCINYLLTVPTAPITIGITVTFMLHIFSNSLARSRHLSFSSLSFNFTLWSYGTEKTHISSNSLSVIIIIIIICSLELFTANADSLSLEFE